MSDDSNNDNKKTIEGEWHEPEALEPTVTATPTGRDRLSIIICALALLTAALTAGGGYWLWQQQQQLATQLAESRSDNAKRSIQLNHAEAQLGELTQALQKVAENQSQTLNALSAEQAAANATARAQADALLALQNQFADWQTRIGGTEVSWRLAEAEWLLWLANTRLQLQGQYAGAEAALAQADDSLRHVNSPQLRPVREAIAESLLALKTAEKPDIDSIALSLLALSNQSAQLPLPARPKPRGEVQSATNDETNSSNKDNWREVLAGLWHELRGLVVIRRQEKNLRPWLSEREEQLIYQGLQVRLDSAHLAALRGKGSLYQQSVRSAQTWLMTWFDNNATAVQAVDSELDSLAKQRLEMTPPDISTALTRLRELRQQGA